MTRAPSLRALALMRKLADGPRLIVEFSGALRDGMIDAAMCEPALVDDDGDTHVYLTPAGRAVLAASIVTGKPS